MTRSSLGVLLHHLHGGTEGASLADISDGQLLERFRTHKEEAAFAALLRRHGPMVLGVCRRALVREQDCEDVFQATFLLLARKAGSIRKRDSIGSWLHGVAQRLAVQCHRQEGRRHVHERQAGLERGEAVPAADAWESLRTLLDEAIAELPEKYRSALVLCYLEDHTHEEAARKLGCRLTTLRSRVARGRERLRTALVRRGLTLTSGAFLAVLAASATQAAVPSSLSMRTLTAALQCARGEAVAGFVSASASALVERGLPTLSPIKLKVLLVLLLAAGLTLGGAGLLAQHILGAKNSAEPPQAEGERIAPPPEIQAKPALDRFGDPLPERAVVRLGTVRFRMGGLVSTCAWSPDGKTLAAGSVSFPSENSITLFDTSTGKPFRQLHDHNHPITSLAYSPDGQILASGSQAGIALWDLASRKLVRMFSCKPGKFTQVWSLAFTPDGKGLVSAGEDARVRLWDPATGKEIRQFTGHEFDVRCAVLSPDGQTLASAADKEIRLWETATGKLIHRLTGQQQKIRALAFSPDGKLLASGSEDFSIGPICLWDTATGKVQRRLPDDPKELQKRRTVSVRSLAFSPDGKTLAAGYGDYGLCLWDVATGKNCHQIPGNGSVTYSGYHDGGIQCVVFARDGKQLLFARDNQMSLLNVASGKEILPDQAHRGTTERVFFSPDSKRLFTTNNEPGQRILEWDAITGKLIRTVPAKATWSRLVSFSPDRKMIASTGSISTHVYLWDTATGKEIRQIPLPLKSSNASPGDIVFSPDGKLLAAEDSDGKTVWLFDAATGKQVCTVEEMGTSAYNMLLAFSPDSRILAAADRKAIHLAEVPSGRQLPSIVPPKERYAVAVALSPDGRTLAAPCTSFFKGGRMILWEVATGKERLSFPEPPGEIRNVAFSPDGRLLAAGAFDNNVYLWDAHTGQLLTQLKGHQGNIETLAFSPDGRRLASGSQDTTALIWDVTGLAKELPRRGSLSQKDLDDLWSTLAGADAAKAYQAILTLESCPDEAVPLMAERLHLKPADDKRIARLLALLDSDDFAERERATKELREMGWAAEPALHTALEDKPSLEARQRVKALLDDIRKQPLPPELLRILRGMEVLEQIGTQAARKVIASLAEGTQQARLTREAKAALQRLH
jgi:RNA polymerase sigma factor (sigma-70 family)